MSKVKKCLVLHLLIGLQLLQISHQQYPDGSNLYANMALNNPTFQSSSYPLSSSSRNAVDGNRDSNFMHGSCSHTGVTSQDLSSPAWWAVDIQNTISVSYVIIINRADCCADRLRDFDIGLTFISPTDKSPNLLNPLTESNIIAHYSGYPPGGIPTTINCINDTRGRYVFIRQTVLDPLAICELEVYGDMYLR